MTDTKFNLNATFDRNLIWTEGGSVRHLVVHLMARQMVENRAAKRNPLNLALVIDASGSMGGGKLEAAKAAARGLAECLTERDHLTIVSFATDVRVHLDAVPVTAENLALIETTLSRLHTRGCTHLSGGWFRGVECVARIAEENPAMTPRVIILSDGHTNRGIVDPAELREHAAALKMRGVQTSALGIGDGYDEHLLQGIAENGGGRLHDAELTNEISSVLLGELDDIFETVIENAKVKLTLPDGVHLEVLGRNTPDIEKRKLLVPVGALQNDIERVHVFRIHCPSASDNAELEFAVSAGGHAADDQSTLEADPVHISLTAVDGLTNRRQSCDFESASIVARAWSAHIVAGAARMNRGPERHEAEAYVRQELGYFRRYVGEFDFGPAMVRELELLERHVQHHFSSRMSKEMIIQSTLAAESRTDRRGLDKATWYERMERGD